MIALTVVEANAAPDSVAAMAHTGMLCQSPAAGDSTIERTASTTPCAADLAEESPRA
jgi:hypothetical protein